MQKPLLAAAAITLLAASCSKDKTSPRADFTGKVQLVDEFGTPQANPSGIQVIATDVSVSNGAQTMVQTASDGTYSLAGLSSSATYDITYAKNGYALCMFPAAIPNPSQTIDIPAVTLTPVSSTLTTLNYVRVTGQSQSPDTKYIISGTVSPVPTAGKPRPHRLFLTNSDNVIIPQPVQLRYTFSVAGTTRPDGTFSDTITTAQLKASSIPVYGKILVWATGDNPAATTYMDPIYKRVVYPASIPQLTNYTTFYYYP